MVVGLLAAVAYAMSEIRPFAHGDITWVMTGGGVVAAGLGASLALEASKKTGLSNAVNHGVTAFGFKKKPAHFRLVAELDSYKVT
jgi:hypothetical protein